MAALFPPIAGVAFDKLCQDIEVNSLIEPLTVDGRFLVDGRNRLRACEKIGVKPHFRKFSDLGLTCSLERYIWSQNVERRHLTDDQRAALAMEWADEIERLAKERQKQHGGTAPGRPRTLEADSPPVSGKGKTRCKLAEMADVSEHKIKLAKSVKQDSPDLLPKVQADEMKLAQAAQAVQERKRPEATPAEAPVEAKQGVRGKPKPRKETRSVAPVVETIPVDDWMKVWVNRIEETAREFWQFYPYRQQIRKHPNFDNLGTKISELKALYDELGQTKKAEPMRTAIPIAIAQACQRQVVDTEFVSPRKERFNEQRNLRSEGTTDVRDAGSTDQATARTGR